MTIEVRELVVFVASPGDLPNERGSVRHAAASVNASIGSKFGVRIYVTGWEEVQPEFGRPQERINRLVEECDIFIGLVNRRWGSPTGTHRSGFEEEFEYAVARRGDSELPHIGIFFKKIPEDLLADPGKELSKVIRFQNRLQAEHLALYKQFDGQADLERQLMIFLGEHVASAVQQMLPRSPEGTVVTVTPEVPGPADSIDSALEQISNTLSGFVDLVQHGSHDGPLDTDRLLLFSLTIQKDSHLLPGHSANRLYRKRDELHLAVGEKTLWLRTLAADVATADSTGWSRTIPGWYMIADSPDFDAKELAEQLAGLANDEDSRVSGGAFILLCQLQLKPILLWATYDVESSSSDHTEVRPSMASSVVDLWVNIIKSDGASERAFAYMAIFATENDLPVLEALITRLEGAKAAIELRAIRDYLTGNPSTLAQLAAGKYTVPLWQEDMVKRDINRLTVDVLDQLITGPHKSNKLRGAALEEAGRRGALSSAMLLAAFANEDPDLLQIVYRYANDADLEVMTEVLSTLENDPGKRDSIPRLLATTIDFEELQARKAQPIAGIVAWEALSWQAGEHVADEAREILDSNASSLVAPLAGLPLEDEQKSTVEYLRSRACRAAVSLLARLPASARTAADVERVRAELDHDRWLTKTEAALALGVLGGTEDVPALLAAATSAYPVNTRQTLLDAAIRLGGIDIARGLATGDDMHNALTGTRALLKMAEARDSELVDLLYSKHGPVRLVALSGLRARWADDRLADLLREYGSRPTSYYYNVFAELDRIIYAPAEIAKLAIVVPMA